MSKKLLGKVIKLFIYNADIQERELKQNITIDLQGVYEDKFYSKNIDRSVLIVSLESYEKAMKNGIDLSHSELGENILVDFNPYSFDAGIQIQIADSILEISQKAPLCPGLSKVNSKLPKLLKNDRGIFAKVIQKGNICTNDSIYLL